MTFVFAIGHADIVYDVNFEPPTQTDGAGIISGPSSDTPSFTTGNPTAVNDASLGSFSSQAAFLNNGGQMDFDSPGGSYTSGIFAISFEATMMDALSGASIAGIGVEDRFEGEIAVVSFDSSGSMDVGSAGNIVTLPYVLGVPSSFSFLIDLDTYLYSATVDGSPVLQDISFANSLDITDVFFNTGSPNPNSSMGVDNFSWTIVPEPSTITLMLVAGIGLCLRRTRNNNLNRLNRG